MFPGSDCTIQDMDIFHGNLVLFLQKNGTPLFCSINMPIDVDVQVYFLCLVSFVMLFVCSEI
jgi:hypothetical protein